jgi:hypothetical protein
MKISLLAVALMFSTFASLARAADPPTTAPSRFVLTIYNPPEDQSQPYYYDENPNADRTADGFAVVREVRPIDLLAGDNMVRFTDVATGIDPTTVAFKSLTAPDSTAVLEQNYEYDLVSGDKLLQKYLGKAVTVHVGHQGANAAAPSVIQGDLLSFDENSLVIQTNGSVEVVSRSEVTQVSLAAMDANLTVKPTLVWKIHAEQAGKHQAQVTYQTDNIGWRADYNLTLNAAESASDVGAWVTIRNQSGLTYPDANLKLVAGNVRRISGPPADDLLRQMKLRRADELADAVAPQFQEQAFFDYHLYTLQRTTSLANNSTKQIELFPSKTAVPVNKTYVYYGLPDQFRGIVYNDSAYSNRDLGTEMNKQVDVYIQMDNTEKNGMGMPLPAGHVRVYKKDPADNSLEFIGEDTIDHTPKDEKLSLRIGTAFDIVGERRQTDFSATNRMIVESFEIVVKNHKAEPINAIVKENLFRWSSWEITTSSDNFQKQDSSTIHFPITVPANGQKTVTYTVRYTW